MNQPESKEDNGVALGYDAVAEAYASYLYRELDDKPFDRAFLERFCLSAPDGKILDAGCGPGHLSSFISDQGREVIGLDISSEMVASASRRKPELDFVVGDMCQMGFEDETFAGVVAFYSIVHFLSEELIEVFRELRRVLMPGGLLGLAFHVGQEMRHVEELWGVRTSLDFVFFMPDDVETSLLQAGFEIVSSVCRDPYPESVEAQTRRCYLLATAGPRASFE